MTEYIEKNKAIKELYKVYDYEFPTASEGFDEYARMIVPNTIKNMPAADVAPVVHGRWIMVDDSCGKYACSVCREIEQECTEWGAGHYTPVDKDYCPNCGAKLDEKEG